MKKITLLLFILSITLNANAQLQNSNWYFGSYAGLNFNGAEYPTILTNSAMYSPNATASVSDALGNLLFYTDGISVYNKNHDYMPNGEESLDGSPEASTTLIIPTPNDPSKYYIFHFEESYESTSLFNLNYAIIDMALDIGNGDVLESGINLQLNTSDRMAVAKTSDGLAYWLIVFGATDSTSAIDTFYSYKIDEFGINLVSQSTFPFYSKYGKLVAGGQMKISPDNANIALVNNISPFFSSDFLHESPNENLSTFDFDETTGVLSNLYVHDNHMFISSYYYGIEFSPDSNLLYVSESLNASGFNNIYQIQYRGDNSFYSIFSTDDASLYSIQKAIDDKLYVATDSDYISAINNPNGLQDACNFVYSAIDFNSTGTAGVTKGLPQYVPDAILSLPPPPLKSNNNPIVLGNPIKDDLKIKFDDVQVYTVEIYNSVSRTIDAPEPIKTVIYEDMKNKKVYHINVSDLPSDTYYLVIRDENQNIWHDTVIKIE
jgi:hypothetical protein